MRARLGRWFVLVVLPALGGSARATEFTDYTWSVGDCAHVRPTQLTLNTCRTVWGCEYSGASFVAPLPGTFSVDLHFDVAGAETVGVLITAGDTLLGFSPGCTSTPCSDDVPGIVFSVKAGDTVEFHQNVGWYSCGFDNQGVTSTFTNLQFYPEVGIDVLEGGVSAAQLYDHDPGQSGTGNSVRGLVQLGDVNGDGLADWACGLPDGGQPWGTGMVQVLSGVDASPVHVLADPGYVNFGIAVADVGDLDGDGVDDLAVTEQDWPGPSWQEAVGRVLVFSGASAAPVCELDGSELFSEFGADVDGVGDIDGDGVSDILLGAPAEDGPAGEDAGCVRVYSGTSQAVLFEARGDGPADFLGADVAGLGDVNGDGTPDFAVCAPGYNPDKPEGHVHVWSGSGSKLYLVTGTTKTEPLARTAAAGDVNADGHPDLIIGAPHAGVPGMSSFGVARVRSGPNGASLLMVSGSEGFEKVGDTLSRAGDLDGDGFADVLVGAPGWHAKRGRVLALSGDGGQSLFEVSPHVGVPNFHFGSHLAAGGDLDGEGTPDLLASGSYRVMGFSGVPAEIVVPVLAIEGTLQGGAPMTVSLTQGPPGGTVAFILGLGFQWLPFKGGLLIPTVDRITAGLPLLPDGSFQVQTIWPPGFSSLIVVQAWMPTDVAAAGFVASDAIVLGPP